jgi:hypothetical protein
MPVVLSWLALFLHHQATRRVTQKQPQPGVFCVFAWGDFVEEILSLFPCAVDLPSLRSATLKVAADFAWKNLLAVASHFSGNSKNTGENSQSLPKTAQDQRANWLDLPHSRH